MKLKVYISLILQHFFIHAFFLRELEKFEKRDCCFGGLMASKKDVFLILCLSLDEINLADL